MKAAVYEKYGSPDVLQLREIEEPAPGDNEILLKVRAAAVTPMDWHFLTGTPFLARIMAGGLFKPKNNILGTQAAGVIKSVGGNVTNFKPGDEVFGSSSKGGSYAEYMCIPASETWHKPEDMSFENAAAVLFSGMTAVICLCDLGNIQPGYKVLINGASGGVGTMAVPIAKHFGTEVTGVCSTRNIELVRSIGADDVIDYTQEDFIRRGIEYDLIFDAVGKRTFAECKPVLSPDGIYITTAFSPLSALQGKLNSMTGSQKNIPMPPVKPKPDIANFFGDLLEDGVLRPVVDRSYPLSEVRQALRYFETGHTRGRIIITI